MDILPDGSELSSLWHRKNCNRELADHRLWMLHNSVQLLSRVWLFETPWTATLQASLSITNSWSLLKLMSIKSAMPSNHLILCCPLLLLPPIFPSIGVFSNEYTFLMRWSKYWSFSFSPSSEYSGLISFRIARDKLTSCHILSDPPVVCCGLVIPFAQLVSSWRAGQALSGSTLWCLWCCCLSVLMCVCSRTNLCYRCLFWRSWNWTRQSGPT